jgi:hypothetical protein
VAQQSAATLETVGKSGSEADALYLVSLEDPSLSYRVLSYDKAKRRATLQGKERPFVMTDFTVDRLHQQGYKLVKAKDLLSQPAMKQSSGRKSRKARLCRCKDGMLCPHSKWLTCRAGPGKQTVH